MNIENLILVVCDPQVNYYKDLNYQLLGKARNMSLKNRAEVICVYWGADGAYADELICYGANRVMWFDRETDDYTIYSKIVKCFIEKYSPELALFTGTSQGKAIAASVATMTCSGLVADCIEIQPTDGSYVFSRAALSSSVIANIICSYDNVQMATIKPNIFIPYVKRIETGEKLVEEFHCSAKSDFPDYVKVLGIKENECSKLGNLEKSKVVFAVGRGVNDEDFKLIEKLAHHFGADVGGTRIMVEKGKILKSMQIGQSGVSVAPDLYVAFGISGANQHIAGIRNAKKIIAVNIDKRAPIFNYADYAVVSDVHNIVEKLLEKENVSLGLKGCLVR